MSNFLMEVASWLVVFLCCFFCFFWGELFWFLGSPSNMHSDILYVSLFAVALLDLLLD